MQGYFKIENARLSPLYFLQKGKNKVGTINI